MRKWEWTWNNGFRDYKAALGRYLESDPLGVRAGINTYAYVLNNPFSGVEPYGLWDWPSLPQGFVDASAGLGDALTMGLAGWVRGKLGISSVNRCSRFYAGGQVAGIVAGLADGEGEVQILFKTSHYAPRLIAEDLDVVETEVAVAREVSATISMADQGVSIGSFSGRFMMGDILMEYRAMPLTGGKINIGTIFPVK